MSSPFLNAPSPKRRFLTVLFAKSTSLFKCTRNLFCCFQLIRFRDSLSSASASRPSDPTSLPSCSQRTLLTSINEYRVSNSQLIASFTAAGVKLPAYLTTVTPSSTSGIPAPVTAPPAQQLHTSSLGPSAMGSSMSMSLSMPQQAASSSHPQHPSMTSAIQPTMMPMTAPQLGNMQGSLLSLLFATGCRLVSAEVMKPCEHPLLFPLLPGMPTMASMTPLNQLTQHMTLQHMAAMSMQNQIGYQPSSFPTPQTLPHDTLLDDPTAVSQAQLHSRPSDLGPSPFEQPTDFMFPTWGDPPLGYYYQPPFFNPHVEEDDGQG
eukprot:m.781980 g.781980  ORF g.781980 m.781980 type:complete len:319 (+) comp59152_c0_seq4:349-1305(+)